MLYCTAIVDFDFRFCDASSHEAEQGRGTDEEQQPPAPLDRFRSVPSCALQRNAEHKTPKLHEGAWPESFRADLFVRESDDEKFWKDGSPLRQSLIRLVRSPEDRRPIGNLISKPHPNVHETTTNTLVHNPARIPPLFV